MADVEVGQVRRPPPRVPNVGASFYHLPPFEVLRAQGLLYVVRYIDSPREWMLHCLDVVRCPLWPSEHEQWKDARGYEVKT